MTTVARKVLAVALCAGALVACGGSSNDTIQSAYDECSESDGVTFDQSKIQVGDEGDTLLVDGAKGSDMPAVACLLGELETPDSMISSMDSTTAMMGRQTDEAGDFKYEWSYHPDNGLDLVVTAG